MSNVQPQTQQTLVVMAGGTMCLSVLATLVMLGVYAFMHDGSVADQVFGLFQTIIVTGIPVLAAFAGVVAHINRPTNSGAAPVVPVVPAPVVAAPAVDPSAGPLIGQ